MSSSLISFSQPLPANGEGDSQITLTQESPFHYNDDSGDTAFLLKGDQNGCVLWENQPLQVIGALADLIWGNFDDFIYRRINQYAEATGQLPQGYTATSDVFDKIEHVYPLKGNTDWQIKASGTTYWRGEEDKYYIETTLSALKGDLETQLSDARVREAERKRKEAEHLKREREAQAQRQEREEREQYAKLHARFGGA